MTGTAAEVTPVRAVDDQELGVGPVTLEIQTDATSTPSTAAASRWAHWLDVVDTIGSGELRSADVVALRLRRDAASRRRGPGRRRVSAEPLGRHSPRSNRRAETSPPYIGAAAKTGCRCIGFQSGRASMSSASSASRICSRSAPNASGSTVMHVSQQFDVPYVASGMNVDARDVAEQLAVAAR